MIEVLSNGAQNSVQDLGRPGHLGQGIGASGAMDGLALRIGNALLGNDPGRAGLEIAIFPFRIRFHAAAAFAVTGADCPATLGGRPLPPWWAGSAEAGDILVLSPPLSGARAMVCFAGGIDVAPVLGSRSTDLKAGFGGFRGRALARGDLLSLGPGPACGPPAPPGFGAVPPAAGEFGAREPGGAAAARVLWAADAADFTDEARASFAAGEWIVTGESNRTGYRLAGPLLSLDRPRELFSHGLVPGTIQVPASGQPIVQLAEANSMGGYPWIATVIEADLWRLAQVPIGGRVRFVPTTRDFAIGALARLLAQADSVRRGAALARESGAGARRFDAGPQARTDFARARPDGIG